MYTYTVKLVYWQLLLYGVHVGHSFKNSTIFSGWLVYTYRQNILIINLFKTMLLLKNGYVGLNAACQFAGPVWFINLHRAVELFVNYAAKQCGEFCYSTYWIHGMISNWIVLANTFRKLNRMITGAHKGQFAKLEMDSTPWIFTRNTWPRVVLVSSVSTSPHPTKEALYACIPCLGIVDTDISGHIANIPIPGNDDSLDCIVFYNTHISQYILEKKYGKVSGWFFHVREAQRSVNFVDWVYAFYINQLGHIKTNKLIKKQKADKNIVKLLKERLTFTIQTGSHWCWGVDFFFGRNYGLTSFKEQVDLFEPDFIEFNIEKICLLHRKKSIFLSKVINYFIIKTSWRFKRYIKRKSFTNKLFKLKFMVGFYHPIGDWESTENYLDQRFLPNKIYKTHLRRNNLRPNKYILKFVKFFYLHKFNYWRGFWSKYSLNLLKVSDLAYVSLCYGSKWFDNHLFQPLLHYGKTFQFFFSKKKKDILYKWGFFKNSIKTYLTKILTNSKINKYLKFYYYYNTFKSLKSIIFKKTRFLYIYYNFFFSFWFWNKEKKLIQKEDKYSFLLSVWKILKKIERNSIYFKFLDKAKVNYSIFRYLFFKKQLFFKKIFNLKNRSFISYFKIFSNEFRKNFIFSNINYIFNKLNVVKHFFKKQIRINKNIRRVNWKCLKFNKQHRFDHLTSYEKADLIFNPYDSSKFLKDFGTDSKKLMYYKHIISKNKFNNIYLWLKKNKLKIFFFYSTWKTLMKSNKLSLKIKQAKIRKLLNNFLIQNKSFNKLTKFFFTNKLIRLYRNKRFIRKNNKHFIWLSKFIKLYSFCHPKLSYIRYISKFKYYNTDLQFHNGSKNYYYFYYAPVLNLIEDDLFNNIKISTNNLIDTLFFKLNHKSFFKFNNNYASYDLNYFFRFQYFRLWSKKKVKKVFFLWNYLLKKGYFYIYNIPLLKRLKNYFLKNYRLSNIYNRYRISLKGINNFIKIGQTKLTLSFTDNYWKYTKNAFIYPIFFYFQLKKNNKNFKLIYKDIYENKINSQKIIISYFFTLRFYFFYQAYFKVLNWNRYIQPKYLGKIYTDKKKIYYWI